MGAAGFENACTEQKGSSEKGVNPRDHILYKGETGFAHSVLQNNSTPEMMLLLPNQICGLHTTAISLAFPEQSLESSLPENCITSYILPGPNPHPGGW